MKSLAFAIRDIFLSPSGISSYPYNSFIARALAALLLSSPPCLPACSYLCLPDVSHICLASLLALITSCTLSFHHQVWNVSLGVVPKPAAIANRPVSFDAKSQFTMTSFSSVTVWTETAQNCLWRICIKQIAKMKMTGSIIDPAGIFFFFTGSIIGPAMAGPTGPFATAL